MTRYRKEHWLCHPGLLCVGAGKEMMTMLDSPTDEIRTVRHLLAARFDNNMQRIVDDLRRQQRESGREYIRLPKRSPRIHPTTNNALHPSGELAVLVDG